VTDEIIKQLDEVEPDPDWLLPLPPEFRAKHWGEVPYVKALVGGGWERGWRLPCRGFEGLAALLWVGQPNCSCSI
jgi:hypothetical protein